MLGWLCLLVREHGVEVLLKAALGWAARVTGCVSVLSVRVHPCVSGVCAQLCYLLGLQKGKRQTCPPTWAETLVPSTGLGPSSWAGAGLGPNDRRRWLCSAPRLTPVTVMVPSASLTETEQQG